MNVRVLASLTVLCLSAGTAVATEAGAAGHAARRVRGGGPVVCDLINDPTVDGTVDLTNGIAKKGPQDPGSDVVTADLASDAKYVTAVIRLKSLASPDTSWPEAHSYVLQWTVPGHSSPVYLSGTIDPDPAAAAFGPQFVFGDAFNFPATGTPVLNGFNIAPAKVKGTVDVAKATVTMSVPISEIRSYGKFTPGAKFTGITASAQVVLNGPVFPTNLPVLGGSAGFGPDTPDTDPAKGPYVAGTPSCVKPGS